MSRRLWGLINSWWLILPFTIYLNWLAFLYVGVTAKHRKWILYGVLYAIPFIFYLFYTLTGQDTSIVNGQPVSLEFEIILSAVWLIGIFSIVHAFSLRKEYLIRLEILKEVKIDELKKEIHQEISLNNPEHSKNIENQDTRTDTNEFVKDLPFKSVSSPVDINNDPEDFLVQLPGVSIILAKKTIQLRESGVYFDSAEEFGQALGIKPHTLEKIKPFIVINPQKDVSTITTSHTKGRRIDI
ncbi:helix-hairpin-helix domain-containing protein [Methanobacterium sp.]|jgi:DNA uptake protein ComE-like DNA-binding protein|uniref:ComEA family DNA-binding protein n=1 Tax=Methanobacterium sp. TaxID=2164 RepID=UPI003158DC95